MSYYIKINNKEIKLKNIENFSFDEYNNLFEILNYNFDDIQNQYKLLLELFTDLELSDIENIKDIYKINFTEILKQEIKSKKVKIKFKNYKLLKLEKMSIGRFIDLEYFLKNIEIEQRLEKLTALLYLPNNFEEEEFNELVETIHIKMNVGNSLQVIELFIAFRNNFYEIYSGLFNIIDSSEDEEEDIIISIEEEEEFDKKIEDEDIDIDTKNNIGVLEFIYILSGDDFLKVDELLESNLYSIMNYISWMKERNDKIKKQSENGKF